MKYRHDFIATTLLLRLLLLRLLLLLHLLDSATSFTPPVELGGNHRGENLDSPAPESQWT